MGAETLTTEGNAAERFYVSTQTDPTESGQLQTLVDTWQFPGKQPLTERPARAG
jgi:hypothetical protein